MFKTTMAISPAPAKFSPLLFAGEWERGLQTAIELGYDAIEVSLRDPQAQVVKDLAKGVRARGFCISAVATGQSYYNDGLCPMSADAGVQATLRERFKGFVDFAAEWHALIIIGGVRGNFEGDPSCYSAQRERVVDAVRVYAEYARSCGVRMAVEPINRYETKFLNTVQETLGFIAEVGADNLCVLADTFHMNIEEVSMSKALQLAGERLAYVHLPDSNRWAAGQGHINFHELVETLHSMRYQGYLGAEILPLPDSRKAAELAMRFFHTLPA